MLCCAVLCCAVLCCYVMLCCYVAWHIVIDIPKIAIAFAFRIKQSVAGLLDPADEGGSQSRQLDVHNNTAVNT